MFGNPPIIGVGSPVWQFDRTQNDTGLRGQWIGGTIDLALALRPDTSTVVVVDGVHDNQDVEAEVRSQLKGRTPQVDLVYLRDPPVADLVARVTAVPEHSVVVFVRQAMVGGAVDADPLEAVSLVVRSSPVPVFGQIEDFVGIGMTGSYVWEFETEARSVWRRSPTASPLERARDIVDRSTYAPVVDWRDFSGGRFRGATPAGSRVLFGTESFFDLHRN